MKLLFKGQKGKAICEHCGPVTTTYVYRDVPLSESGKIVKDILVGACDQCESVVSIPAQSTPAIRMEREKASQSIEALLPAPYIEALDLAAFRIASRATPEMRKFLVIAYLHKHATTQGRPSNWEAFEQAFAAQLMPPKKRLSIKVSTTIADEFIKVTHAFKMNKTNTLKSIVSEIKEDILDNDRIRPELQTLAHITAN